jgi:uncharacterized protein (DUF924 family)
LAAPPRRWAAELLNFWFRKLGPRDWFRGGPHVDAALRKRFERELTMLRTRPPAEFLADPQTARAAVLLFDQVPRNIYRGQRRSFAFDPLARSIARGALRRGYDKRLDRAERQFLAMPLMHSEHISDQLRSLAFYRSLPRHGWPFARSHYSMIARFGRFPHRNHALGRKSSAAEIAAVEAGNHW